MLLAARSATLDAGSVALGLCRRWSDAGRRSLFIDADLDGTSLAERFNAATRAGCSPAERGIPSLVVSGQPLGLDAVAQHSYTVPGAAENMWLLFAPRHPGGAEYAAGWLGERTPEMLALDAERSVVVASGLRGREGILQPLLEAAPTVVVLAPAATAAEVEELQTLARSPGPAGPSGQRRMLLIEGQSTMSDDELESAAGLEVVGRLPVMADEKILRLLVERVPAGSPRLRQFSRGLASVAGVLEHLLFDGSQVPALLNGFDHDREPSPGEPPVEAPVVQPGDATEAAHGTGGSGE